MSAAPTLRAQPGLAWWFPSHRPVFSVLHCSSIHPVAARVIFLKPKSNLISLGFKPTETYSDPYSPQDTVPILGLAHEQPLPLSPRVWLLSSAPTSLLAGPSDPQPSTPATCECSQMPPAVPQMHHASHTSGSFPRQFPLPGGSSHPLYSHEKFVFFLQDPAQTVPLPKSLPVHSPSKCHHSPFHLFSHILPLENLPLSIPHAGVHMVLSPPKH